MLNRSNILLLFKIAAITCALAIIFISVMPNNAGIQPPSLNDKINHIIGYSVLSGLGVLAWRGKPRVWFLALIFIQSACVEILQANMDLGRDGSWGDMIANVIGILLGLFCGQSVLVIIRQVTGRISGRA